MGKKISRPDPGEASEAGGFDMTPMIDVTFLLIIFFMCVTEMKDSARSKLILPRTVNGEPDVEPVPGRLLINVLRDGKIEINARPYSEAELNVTLKAHYAMSVSNPGDTSEKPILLRADMSTKYEDVQKVMQMCMDNRLYKISFAALGPDPNK